jgi:hypothetical protein
MIGRKCGRIVKDAPKRHDGWIVFGGWVSVLLVWTDWNCKRTE